MKKHALYYLLIFVAVYSIGYIAEYNNSRRDIENNINELFKVSSQSFNDSIRNIKNIFLYYTFDSKHLEKRKDMICVSEEGELRISQ